MYFSLFDARVDFKAIPLNSYTVSRVPFIACMSDEVGAMQSIRTERNCHGRLWSTKRHDIVASSSRVAATAQTMLYELLHAAACCIDDEILHWTGSCRVTWSAAASDTQPTPLWRQSQYQNVTFHACYLFISPEAFSSTSVNRHCRNLHTWRSFSDWQKLSAAEFLKVPLK